MAITAGMVKELRETTGAEEERCSKDGKESCQNRCRGYLPCRS